MIEKKLFFGYIFTQSHGNIYSLRVHNRRYAPLEYKGGNTLLETTSMLIQRISKHNTNECKNTQILPLGHLMNIL